MSRCAACLSRCDGSLCDRCAYAAGRVRPHGSRHWFAPVTSATAEIEACLEADGRWPLVPDRCVYCARPGMTLTRDHVFPRSLGGRDYARNVVCCCGQCNNSKSDLLVHEWPLAWAAKHGGDPSDLIGLPLAEQAAAAVARGWIPIGKIRAERFGLVVEALDRWLRDELVLTRPGRRVLDKRGMRVR